MPTNPTAIYTRGFWGTSIAVPWNAVYDAGWFLQPEVDVVAEAIFPLRGPFAAIGLVAAVAFDRSLGAHIGLAIQLPSGASLALPLRGMLEFTFGLGASEDFHDLL